MQKPKIVTFKRSPSAKEVNVLYVLYEKQRKCTFTSLVQGIYGSSINFAELIINNICENENLNPFMVRFFDLQTCCGYRVFPGFYQYDELSLSQGNSRTYGIDVDSWCPAECPEKILKIFSSQINGPIPIRDNENVNKNINCPSDEDLIEYVKAAAKFWKGQPSDIALTIRKHVEKSDLTARCIHCAKKANEINSLLHEARHPRFRKYPETQL